MGAEDKESPVAEIEHGLEQDEQVRAPAARASEPSRPSAGPAGVGLKIYKPGQGYYTRVCTAVGMGILGVWGAYFIADQAGAYMDHKTSYFLGVQYGLGVGFLVLVGGLTYWLVGLSRKANDFFIATEGEMKKVNWSDRQEITRSTKVVIVATLLLSVFLFLADIAFMEFFSVIKVLRIPSTLQRFFGSES